MNIPHYRLSLVRERTTRYKVDDPQLAAKVCHSLLDDSPVEKILVLYLDGLNNIIGSEYVGQGGLHGCSIAPRDIFRGAIVACASAVIMAHNHPSGDPSPSDEDIELTKLVVAAGKILKLHVVDHIITCPNGLDKSLFVELGIF